MPGRPTATYRVQLRPGFGFDEAAAIAGYLADLGITHLYASPYLQAAPGSTHGYDVVDHSRVSGDLGGDEGHARLCAALAGRGLGQILDIVPNHMAIAGRENRWWWDVLENGPASTYATYFDVDWDPPESKLRDVVLMPVLGDHYGRVLERGELTLRRERGTFTVHYADHVLPVAPRSLDDLLAEAAAASDSAELESIAAALGRLPHSTATDRESVRERHRDKEVLRERLAGLCDEHPEVARAIDAVVDATSSDPDRLDALLDRQNYRLSFWRTAGQELDYRRFFDINTLVGLRVEDDQVFADTHALVIEWLERGVLDGVRVDHPDGLRDPEAYLTRLERAAPSAWVVVEKILEPGERLRRTWPVAGTTGYDSLSLVGGLFVDPAGEVALTDAYGSSSAVRDSFDAVAYESRQFVLREVLAADVHRLTNRLAQICERQRQYRDYTRPELREALRELIACFPVYRTYVDPVAGRIDDDDRGYVEHAATHAEAHRPDLDPFLWQLLRKLLLLEVTGDLEADFVARFQQLTGPAMAKGVEDTAFYRYHRLVSLNEVGGSPARFGVGVAEFHAGAARLARDWPATMTALSTHDTKRSEDVRARVALLSEIPQAWAAAVGRWSAGRDIPDANVAWLLFQTLVGAHPLPADRARAYLEKATREAKVHTSWTDPVPEYDAAVAKLVDDLLGDDTFVADLDAFVAPLVEPGRINSLAQKLVQLTMPGVPDVYQGTELWDLSLVDPDNRRPVDYETRRGLLGEVETMTAAQAWARADEGVPKLLVVTRALRLRRALGDLGGYTPLRTDGARAAHVVAFAREAGSLTIVPRLVLGLRRSGGWRDTVVEIPPGRWRDEFTGTEVGAGLVDVHHLLGAFPVALLRRLA